MLQALGAAQNYYSESVACVGETHKNAASDPSAEELAKRPCCGAGCKNCPYDPRHQEGNTKLREGALKSAATNQDGTISAWALRYWGEVNESVARKIRDMDAAEQAVALKGRVTVKSRACGHQIRQGDNGVEVEIGKKCFLCLSLGKTKSASIAAALRKARNATHQHPTPAQVETGNYKKGRLNFKGIEIAIENPVDSFRRGTNKQGVQWETRMKNDYGYVVGTKAIDGDAVDVFIGPDLDSDLVVAVDQYFGDEFDETKFIVAVKDRAQGEQVYLDNYQKGWKLGPVSTCTVQQFKQWLKTGKTKKPFKGQMVKAAFDWASAATTSVPVVGPYLALLRDKMSGRSTGDAMDRFIKSTKSPEAFAGGATGVALGGLTGHRLVAVSPAIRSVADRADTVIFGNKGKELFRGASARALAGGALALLLGGAGRAYALGKSASNQEPDDTRIHGFLASLLPGVVSAGYTKTMPGLIRPAEMSVAQRESAAKALFNLMRKAKEESVAVYNMGNPLPRASDTGKMKDYLSRAFSMRTALSEPDGLMFQKMFNSGPHYLEDGKALRAMLGESLVHGQKIRGAINMHDAHLGKSVNLRPGILAHELGHAMQPKWMKSNVARVGLKAGPLAGLVPILGTDNETAALAGVGLGTAATVPGLVGEVSASMRGRDLLRQSMGPSRWATFGRMGRLSPFIGLPTYAAVAATPAAAYLGRKLTGGYKE